MKGVFISATNTNSGKTWLSVKLISYLLEAVLEKNIRAIKPIQSGFKKKNTKGSDCQLIHQALTDTNYSRESIHISEVCLYSFKQAIAPNQAARLNNKSYQLAHLVEFIQKQIEKGFCVVEGAGGLFSPIADDGLNWHLAKILNLPVILLTNDELGSISETIATVIAAQELKIKLLAIIINRYKPSSERRTKQELKKWLSNETILSIRQDAREKEIKSLMFNLKELMQRNIDSTSQEEN